MTLFLLAPELPIPLATTTARQPFETAPRSYWRSVELLRAARQLQRGQRLATADGVALGMNRAASPPVTLDPQVKS